MVNKKKTTSKASINNARLPLTSMDVAKDRINQLENLFPETVAEGKVDFDKLKAALGEKIENGPERYGLTWAERYNNV